MLNNGGLEHYQELADIRSKMLYDFIDNSNGFYFSEVQKKYRSKINVPFRIRPDQEEDGSGFTRLELLFVVQAKQHGLLQLKGHSSNPGLRISMYNAMKVEGVEKLCNFMREF